MKLTMKTKLRLQSYSAMAVGIFISQQADTQVVYQNIDPDGYADWWSGYQLDMDGDGTFDFGFDIDSFGACSVCATHKEFSIIGYESNQMVYNFEATWANNCWSTYVVSDLFSPMIPEGRPIRPDLPFVGGPLLIFLNDWNGGYCLSGYGLGDFAYNEYAGVRFKIDGEYHYGWIRLLLDGWEGDFHATILDYAYEATSNTPILAGDMSTPVCIAPVVTSVVTTPVGFKLTWDAVDNAIGYKIYYREVGAGSWNIALTTMAKYKITGLECDSEYEYQIATVCDDEIGASIESSPSPVAFATTNSCRLISEQSDDENNIQVHSQGDNIYVIFEEELISPYKFTLINQLGQVVMTRDINDQNNIISTDLPDGIYIVSIRNEFGEVNHPVIVGD